MIEQFDGYFGLETLPVTLDENDMPQYPPGYHHHNLAGSKLLKQPDVVMLTYVLSDEFADAVKLANYEYYEPLTLHKSSLSPAVHAIMGIEVGDPAAPCSTSAAPRSWTSSTTRGTPRKGSISPPPAGPGRWWCAGSAGSGSTAAG